MTQLTPQIPQSTFAALHQAPDEFRQEMRIASAMTWYQLGRISQGRAAEIAGLTPAAIIDTLSPTTGSAPLNTPLTSWPRNSTMGIDAVVANASPLITLLRSAQAGLLPGLFAHITAPEAVWTEVVVDR